MEALETLKHNNHTIEIHYDQDPESPREWDNLGTMLCLHLSRYNLGDKRNYDGQEIEEIYKSPENIALPLYLYDHSGITINTTGFSCPWDSGQVGIIYVAREKVREEYKVKRISKKLESRILDSLRSEVSTYDDYLTGQVYGYKIKDNQGEEIESCWGFYGLDTVRTEALSIVNHLSKQAA
jgi:hypothetical protein